MTRASKWFPRLAGGLTGVAGPGDDVLLYTRYGKSFLTTRPNLKWGVKNLAGPVGIYGKTEFVDKVILGGASARALEILTYGRYRAPESAWNNSPKARLQRLRSRAVRMEKGNASSMDRWTVHKQDYAREGIVWMP